MIENTASVLLADTSRIENPQYICITNKKKKVGFLICA